MASVRKLTRGGFSVSVSDTEMSLMLSAIQMAQSEENPINLEDIPEEHRKVIYEAVNIRRSALQNLASNLEQYEEELPSPSGSSSFTGT